MADVKYYMKGFNGQLTVYDNKVTIERKGFYGIARHGLSGEKNIPMDSIVSVQFRKATLMAQGFIQFGVLGGKESTGGVIAASGDENTVMIKAKENELAEEIKDYIEGIILNRSKGQGNVIQQVSDADELKKFKELLDAGIINEEEFNVKKKQILGL